MTNTTNNSSVLNWEVICETEVTRAPKVSPKADYSKRRKQNFKCVTRYAYDSETKTHIVQNQSFSDKWLLFVAPNSIDYRKYNFGKLERWESYKWNGKKLIARGHAGVKFYTPQNLNHIGAVNHQGSYWDFSGLPSAFAQRLAQAAMVFWAKEVNPWMDFKCCTQMEFPNARPLDSDSLIRLLRFPHYPWGCVFAANKGSMRQFHKPIDWAVKQLFGSTGKACKKAYLRQRKLEARWFPLCKKLQQKGWTTDHLLSLFNFGLTRNLTLFMEFILLLDMTPKKALRLVKKLGNGTVYDIMEQLKTLRTRGINLDINNTSCFESTHDALTKVLQEVLSDEDEYQLWHYPELDTLAKSTWVNNQYKIVIPKTNKQLWEWSSHFSNCVGSYVSRIHSGSTSVFALADKDTDELLHCVEIRPEAYRSNGVKAYRTQLVQCSTFRNDVDDEVYITFEKEIANVVIKYDYQERLIVPINREQEIVLDWQSKFDYLVSRLHQERLRRERIKAERRAARNGMAVATAPDAATYFGTHENVVDAPNLDDILW